MGLGKNSFRLGLIILCITSFSLVGSGQNHTKSDIKLTKSFVDKEIERAMKEIDNSAFLSTDILLDKSVLHENVLNAKHEIITFREWEQILFSLSRGQREPLSTFYEYKSQIEDYNRKHPDLVYLGLLNYEYDRIKDNAFGKGGLYLIDGVIHELFKKDKGASSPYELGQAFEGAVLKDEITFDKEINFVLKSDFCFFNIETIYERLMIDFDDGLGFRIVEVNEPISINYKSTGKKVMKFQYLVDKSDTLTSNVEFMVSAAAPGPISKGTWMMPPSKSTGSGGEDSVVIGEVELYSQHSLASVDKPVLFIEGLDYKNEENAEEILEKFNEYDLIDQLADNQYGYDIFTLNFVNNLSLGEPNLFIYAEIIDSLVEMVKPFANEGIAIVAGGTGALAARLSLARMESKGIDHEVNLFVAIDCPNQGANIPLGSQYWAEELVNQGYGAVNVNDLIQSDIAKQILLYHKSGMLADMPGANPLKSNFYDSLLQCGTNGYPVNGIRKVAISNGSGFGNELYPAGQSLVYWEYHKNYLNYYGDVFALSQINNSTIFDSKFNITTGIDQYKHVETQNASTYDNGAGSTLSITSDIVNGVSIPALFLVSYENHCFVPIESAFDISSLDYWSNKNLIHNAKNVTSPFDSLYCETNNNPHLEILDNNSSWIFNEVVGVSETKTKTTSTKNQYMSAEQFSFSAIYSNGIVEVSLESYNSSMSRIDIINQQGQIIKQTELNGNRGAIDLSSYANGLYTVRIENNNESYIEKILKM